MHKQKKINQRGQSLVILLVVVVSSIILSTALISLAIINNANNSLYEQAITAQSLAESGVENAILNLLRNPNYTGEIMIIDNKEVELTVQGTTNKVITSTCDYGQVTQSIEVTADYDSGILTINNWEPTYQ